MHLRLPLVLLRIHQVMMQLERMFGEGARSALTFSSHRWGEQPLTSGNGGGKGGGHDDMGSPELRMHFVRCYTQCTAKSIALWNFNCSRALDSYPTARQWER